MSNRLSITPKSLDEIIKISSLYKKNPRFLPSDKQSYSEEELAIIINTGLDLDLTVTQSMEGLLFINGKAALWGDILVGKVWASGKMTDFKEWSEGSLKDGTYIANCSAKRGSSVEIKRSFSFKDATRAGLIGKGNIWKKYPQRMMQMRARSWALRDGFADVLKGLVAVEEAIDFSSHLDYNHNQEKMSEEFKLFSPSGEEHKKNDLAAKAEKHPYDEVPDVTTKKEEQISISFPRDDSGKVKDHDTELGKGYRAAGPVTKMIRKFVSSEMAKMAKIEGNIEESEYFIYINGLGGKIRSMAISNGIPKDWTNEFISKFSTSYALELITLSHKYLQETSESRGTTVEKLAQRAINNFDKYIEALIVSLPCEDKEEGE